MKLFELSSWMSASIAKEFWGGVKVTSTGDGTYVYCQKLGGFMGNKELFSPHKLRPLQKVMVFATTRGYIVFNSAGYGGSGRYSDKNLLDLIFEKAEDELESDPNVKNVISFFNLTPDTVSENALVVDRGFEGCKQEYVTLISPKGKRKSKVSGKTTVAKQHTADQAAKNRTVTRVRNIIERVFPVAIKSWGVLGGKTLHFAYFEHIPAYVDIASAFHNAFRGCIDSKKGDMDEQDFETMKARIAHKNEIGTMLKKSKHRRTLKNGKFVRFSPEEEKSIPEMSTESIRKYACGPYAMSLADPYVEFWRELGSEIKFSKYKSGNRVLIKATGLKSRYSPRNAREVFVLFKGDPLTLTDTLCSCHGGLRPIGGCAHAIAILILLGQRAGYLEQREPTRSELMLKRGLVLYDDSESETSDSESDDSSSSSDTDSSA